MPKETVISDLSIACPRCGKFHRQLPWMKLENAAIFNGVYMRYWTMCPTNTEPIFGDNILMEELFKSQ